MTENRDIEEIFSKSIRSGRRTYFFDVRSTRAKDYYLTITESKRDFNKDGTPFYKKHKIYLYKEDFVNFKEALNDVCSYIIKEKGKEIISNTETKNKNVSESKEESITKDNPSTDFTEVNFDDLGKD
ncbi:PUR family DNA/RNA-binding protein [Flavobacteriales bacterium]|nr:PUR family DNA/RNA-binding protein [Flavobacteriales bacterium]